jgi:hypothetical protein
MNHPSTLSAVRELLNEASQTSFDKDMSRLKTLKNRLADQKAIADKQPSFELNRARNSVAYHSKLFNEHLEVYERRRNLIEEEKRRRIRAAEEDCQKRIRAAEEFFEKEVGQLDKWNYEAEASKKRNLEDAEQRLTIESSKMPRNVVSVELEVRNHMRNMIDKYPYLTEQLFDNYISQSDYISVAPQVKKATPLTEDNFPLFGGEREVARMRKEVADAERIKKRELEERERERKSKEIEDAKRMRAAVEEQERKRQDEIRQRELKGEVITFAPQQTSSNSSLTDPKDEDDGYDSEIIREGIRREQEAKAARLAKMTTAQPPITPPPPSRPKKTVKRVQIKEIAPGISLYPLPLLDD